MSESDVESHPLKHLRAVLSMSQAEFAKLVGLSRIYISNVEAGTRRLTEDSAQKISRATGIDPRCLIEGLYSNQGYKALNDDNPGYTLMHYFNWRVVQFSVSIDRIPGLIQVAQNRLSTLLLAAHVADHFEVIRSEIIRKLEEIEDRYDLAEIGNEINMNMPGLMEMQAVSNEDFERYKSILGFLRKANLSKVYSKAQTPDSSPKRPRGRPRKDGRPAGSVEAKQADEARLEDQKKKAAKEKP